MSVEANIEWKGEGETGIEIVEEKTACREDGTEVERFHNFLTVADLFSLDRREDSEQDKQHRGPARTESSEAGGRRLAEMPHHVSQVHTQLLGHWRAQKGKKLTEEGKREDK
ncbi:hypothetical protein NDU88_002515 [Pleurodeles waltl]|uniref:Uncharacterized protein n=1 Tax=Pleurodeles waltl TaxID=8319 RepID=A0AAV7MRX9_PLEWA|nr:hypothetical protein NDU88_002515 [Pleurodeles waltl]